MYNEQYVKLQNKIDKIKSEYEYLKEKSNPNLLRVLYLLDQTRKTYILILSALSLDKITQDETIDLAKQCVALYNKLQEFRDELTVS